MGSSLVVLNKKAGTIAAGPPIEERVRDAFARAGSTPVVIAVDPKDIEKTVREGIAQGVDVIFVGGGDGTLATAARCLAGSATALGVLPLGTKNHFARDLGISLVIDEAVTALVRGRVEEVDLGDVNGLLFLNNVSIGIYPRAVVSREWHQKRIGMSKATAWIWAMINVFWSYPMQVLRIRWEGRETLMRTPFVLVGNNEYVIASEDFGRRASLRSGTLSAYYAPRIGRFRFLWSATKALFGFVGNGLDLEKILTARLTVETRKRRLEIAADGELHLLTPPLEFHVRPHALRVVLPEPAP